jgi:DNA-binding LacI/PurR family transcriptional regulator
MVRQIDIAREAGTSVPTVCRVLAGRGEECGITPGTARRVREAAKRLGYKPNLVARALRTKRNQTMGVLFNSTAEPLYAELVPAIQSRLYARGYAAICGFWTNPDAEAGDTIRAVVEHGVDGVITCHEPGQLPADIPEMPPTVFFAVDDPKRDTVNVNGPESLVEAVSHLVAKGHRRLALVDIPCSYADAILAPHPDLPVSLPGFDIDYAALDAPGAGGLEEIAGHLAAMAPAKRPTGVVCRNDLVAVRLIALLAQAGLRVPDDISVIGFDDTRLARWSSPSLTSSGAPVGKLADALVDTLFARLAHPHCPPMHVVVPRVLNARGSTAAPTSQLELATRT